MEAARLIAMGQIKQAEKEISKLQGTKNNSSLMWWEAVKFASENILQGLEHDIELEASTEFREFMITQEELERDRPIDVQI
ncbi:hypothetical protein [Clostridioides difficile]|uniref:hypothetical protein n=1 Tax=Clostridioides difficile TaxID=1496 RepID=UPI001A1FF1AB|nr:hypothetical protein [Clostridioides difficile]MBH7802517.1 hypothetical protein [Clostridioides difficile]MBH7815955.1 hypothetical protein [Clostridioides difficile]MBY2222597.1 hypothetical protein [Clostridioides difficile]MCC8862558.1 hypothetical protein [Clostridioides difficile]MCL6846403.1 hypothetical protein [Clostridioides difficile]